MRYLILFLVFLVFGCTSPKIVTELEIIDELIDSQPDSAFAIIKSINPDDIHGGADKSFYALLYTQAQYKNYEQIHSDSLIDVAVDYYENTPIADRLTRAYMYKAAALSDMEQHKEAIEWLKKAETVADTSDNLTLGLINSHIGELYQRNYVINDEDRKRYKQALNYYRQAEHKRFENHTLNAIGILYCTNNLDSAQYYLHQGVELSQKINDTIAVYKNMTALAKVYILSGDYLKAKDISLSVYKYAHSRNLRLLCALATSYAKLNKIDSAEYYFNKIEVVKSSGDSVAYYSTIADISTARRDFEKAYHAKLISTEIADRVIDNSRKSDLIAVEKQFDKTLIMERAKQLEAENKLKDYLIVIVILILIIIVSVVYYTLRDRAKREEERRLMVERLKTEIEYQNEKLSNLENIQTLSSEKEEALKKIADSKIAVFRKLAEIKHEFRANPDIFLKKFDEIILDTRNEESSVSQIIYIANTFHNNIIDKIAAKEPLLVYKELLMLSMTCLEFKSVEMCVYLKSPSIDATYMLRQRLIKKLKVKSLEEFITQEMML